jgi:hypothetical protein
MGLKTNSKTKQARMFVAIADACNVVIGKQPTTGPAAVNAVRQAAFLKLFAKTKNTLIMSGSDMGQYSFYLPTGGFFSARLVDALEDEFLKGDNASWDQIIAKATQPFPPVPYQGQSYIQVPIAQSDLAPVTP